MTQYASNSKMKKFYFKFLFEHQLSKFNISKTWKDNLGHNMITDFTWKYSYRTYLQLLGNEQIRASPPGCTTILYGKSLPVPTLRMKSRPFLLGIISF